MLTARRDDQILGQSPHWRQRALLLERESIQAYQSVKLHFSEKNPADWIWAFEKYPILDDGTYLHIMRISYVKKHMCNTENQFFVMQFSLSWKVCLIHFDLAIVSMRYADLSFLNCKYIRLGLCIKIYKIFINIFYIWVVSSSDFEAVFSKESIKSAKVIVKHICRNMEPGCQMQITKSELFCRFFLLALKLSTDIITRHFNGGETFWALCVWFFFHKVVRGFQDLILSGFSGKFCSSPLMASFTTVSFY